MSVDTTPRAPSSSASTPRREPPTSLGRDLPSVPRRYGQWAGAVLFVVMAVLLAGWFWQQRDERVPVLAVVGTVPAGETISSDDLRVVEVAGLDAAIPSDQSSTVIGSTAAVGLVEGQVLTASMLSADPIPGPGDRVVGLQLDATRAPVGLRSGDVVIVVAVPPPGDPSKPSDLDSPEVLADRAEVASAELIEGAGTRLTLVVEADVFERVIAYVAAGRVALLQAPVGGDD